MPTRVITGPRPREISDLVLDLQRAKGREPDPSNPKDAGHRGRAVFLIGAGCSRSADIKLAADVAKVAVAKLAVDYGVAKGDVDAAVALAALIEARRFPDTFAPTNGKAPWGEIYGYVFSEHLKHPNEQRDLITEIVGNADGTLNWAHACLGALVEGRFVHTILTTNFDQLALQGVIRTGILPVVADGLESLNRISPTPIKPQIVHLHGSMHTYELRNSYAALRETENDRGLQVMMMSLLKEATVLVVIGYAGGEEGVMTLLQYAAKALPRMVVYWVAHDDDLELLSPRAKDLLSTGENKFFILGQDADDFFNQLVGEVGIGAPDWISNPLAVLKRQASITFDGAASVDVKRLVAGYAERVGHAAVHGAKEESLAQLATERRSALRFREAAEIIQREERYADDDELLSIHADSLYGHYKRVARDRASLEKAVAEFETLTQRTKAARIPDVITYIDAQRDLSDWLAGEDDDEAENSIGKLSALYCRIETLAASILAADPDLDRRQRSLLEFYQAEAIQAQAEQARREDDAQSGEDRRGRRERLETARRLYAGALPGLAATDATKAQECKEGLSGALIAISEYEGTGTGAAARIREAQTLSREVVGSARVNTPGKEHAGALQNLAEALRTMRLKFADQVHGSRSEEDDVVRRALAIYEEIGDADKMGQMRRLLDGGDEASPRSRRQSSPQVDASAAGTPATGDDATDRSEATPRRRRLRRPKSA